MFAPRDAHCPNAFANRVKRMKSIEVDLRTVMMKIYFSEVDATRHIWMRLDMASKPGQLASRKEIKANN